MDVKNINQFFVAAACTRTAGVQIHEPSDAATYIGKGEVVITDSFGNVLDATTMPADLKEIYIHQRSADGKSMYKSAPLVGSTIKNMFNKQYSAPVEQVTTIGYNGVSGFFDAPLVASTLYSMRLTSLYSSANTPLTTKSYGYSSGLSTPTQAEIVSGLVKNFAFSNSKDLDFSIKAEAITDSVTTASTSGDLTVSYGSKTVVAATDIANGGMVAGDFLFISGVAYKVASIDTVNNTATLEYPYQGTSGTVLDANCSFITLANANAGNWGIKLTGLPYTVEPGKWKYRKEIFDVQVGSTINSVPTVLTAGSNGVGSSDEVAEMEWYNKSFFGNQDKINPVLRANINLDTVPGETYDILTINWANDETENIEGSTHQTGTVSIALGLSVTPSQRQGGTTTIKEVLEKFVVTNNGKQGLITVS